MIKKNDNNAENNESANSQQQTRTIFSITPSGCLIVIILSAIAGIAINEYKRSKLRLEHDRQKYQQNDTIAPNATTQNTLFLKYLPRSR